MEGSKYAGAAAASLPGVCPRPGGEGRRANPHATRSPGDSAECEAGGRDQGRAAGQRQTGVGKGAAGGGEGWLLAAGYGDGPVPAADGVRTRGGEEGGEGDEPAPRVTSEKPPPPTPPPPSSLLPQFLRLAGSAPERRGRGKREEEEGGDRRAGARRREAGLRETGGKAPSIGRLNVVRPRRCKARADWSVRLPSPAPPGVGCLQSECSGEHVLGKEEAAG
ncbi:uncharacterized protein [Gorilla gorilla gorilla]|uniref:uncharacterized protein n=1 Tax=Gorilla gorilla gorilla TaxID=9595 RepID=UPI00300A2D89